MAEKIVIDGEECIDVKDAAVLLDGITTKRVLEFIREKRLDAHYLNGYYIPVRALAKVKHRKPGRPPLKAKKK